MRVFAQLFLVIIISALPTAGWSVDLNDQLPEAVPDMATPEDEELPILVVGPDMSLAETTEYVRLDESQPAKDPNICGMRRDCQGNLEDRVRRLERLTRQRPYGFGLNLGMPTDGQFAYWMVEANYRWLYANYVLARGGGPGLKAELNFANRVDWQVVRLGVTFWHGEPLSVTEVNRNWDITLGTSVGVRLWRGLKVTLGVNWYIPNPFETSSWALQKSNSLANEAYQKELTDLLKKLDDALSGESVENAYVPPATWPSSSDINDRVYRDAIRHPNVLLGWYYEF